MSAPPGPKELANRANADAKRKRRLVPYAGKPKGNEAVVDTYGRKPTNTGTPRKKRKPTKEIA